MNIEDKIKIIVERVCAAYGCQPIAITPKVCEQIVEQEEASHIMEGDLLCICDMVELWRQGHLTRADLGATIASEPYHFLTRWPYQVALAMSHKRVIANRRATRDRKALEVEHEDEPPEGFDDVHYGPRVKLSEVPSLDRGRPDYIEPDEEDWAQWRKMKEAHAKGERFVPDPNWWGYEEYMQKLAKYE